MAQALARGFQQAGLLAAEDVVFFDPADAAANAMSTALPGSQRLGSEAEVAEQASLLLLAVKPQVMPNVLEQLAGTLDQQTLVVSIAAGVGLSTLQQQLGTERIVRVMPNTPCLVAEGAAAFSVGRDVSDEDKQQLTELLEAVGIAIEVEESQMDAVTGLSGSGPAYVYSVIEYLSDAGVEQGLSREIAQRLAVQTVRGAALMVEQTGEHPSDLRDRVSSPGGTTLAGLKSLADHGLRAALLAAVEAATVRSEELGR